MFDTCPVCGARSLNLFRRAAACPKCGTASEDVETVRSPSATLELPPRSSPSLADEIRGQRVKVKHNWGIEGTTEVFFAWEDVLQRRPIDIPFYTAMNGIAFIAVLLSRRIMGGPAAIEELRNTSHPFGLHVAAFPDAAFPVLRMSLRVPDNPKDPLWLESPLDVSEGNVQDFLETAVRRERVELLMAHEAMISRLVSFPLRARGLAAVLRDEVRKVTRALPPGAGRADLVAAVQRMERVYPQPYSGIDPKRMIRMPIDA